MTCRHGVERRDCAETCARCDHGCHAHRAQAHGRGAGGDACWECAGMSTCEAWVQRTGDAGMDAALELEALTGITMHRVVVRSRGKRIGDVTLVHDGEDVRVLLVSLRRKVRGKGIGQALYRMLGREIAPLVLVSGKTQTEDARQLWAALERKGAAVRDGNGFRLENP